MSAPLFPHPPTLNDEVAGVRVWCFDESATVVDQVTSAAMSVAVTSVLTGAMEVELQRRYVRAGRSVTFVHDWRACQSYDPAARQALIDWGRASRSHTRQVSIALSPDASMFLRIAASTGVSLLRAAGMRIALVDTLEPIVASLGGRGG